MSEQSQPKSDALAIEHFNELYKSQGFKSQRHYPAEELCRFIGRTYGIQAEGIRQEKIKILEVGCGLGGNLWMLAKEGFEAYGMDSSDEGLKLCAQLLKSKWGVHADLKVGNFFKLPYPDQFFDAVVDVVSLQHVDIAGHRKALVEVVRVLKPGGRLFSFHLGQESYPFLHSHTEKLDPFTVAGIQNPQSPYDGVGVTCFISAEQYAILLKEAGFEKVSIEQITRTYGSPDKVVQYLSVEAIRT